MLNGVLKCGASLGFLHTRCGKQLSQRDVVAAADDRIQKLFQLVGAPHMQAGEQCCTAADHLGKAAEQLAPVDVVGEQPKNIGQPGETRHQKDRTNDRAQGRQVFLALAGSLLVVGGAVGVWGSGRTGHGRRACRTDLHRRSVREPCRGLLLLLGIFVDAFQDEQQQAQRCRDGKGNEDGDGGDLRKIMFFWLHGQKTSQSGIPAPAGTEKDHVPLYYSGAWSFC